MFSSKHISLLSLSLVATCQAGSAMRQVESVASSALRSQGWSVSRILAGSQEITLEIGLTMQNTGNLMGTLMDLSNPRSKNYGKWFTKEEADAMFRPKAESNDAVVNWLKSEGVTKIHTDGTWITFATNIDTANRLIAADFQQYEREGVKKIRTTEYSVPEDLMQHIELIHPTTFFGQTREYKPAHMSKQRTVRREASVERRQTAPSAAVPAASPAASPPVAPPAAAPSPDTPKQVPSLPKQVPAPPKQVPAPPKQVPAPPKQVPAPPKQVPPAPKQVPGSPRPPRGQDGVRGDAPYFTVDPKCKNGITPSCVRDLYNVGNYTPTANSGSKIGFSSFLNQSYQYEDLKLFQKTFKLPYQNATKVFVNSAIDSQDPSIAGPNAGEANLDAQNILGLAQPLPVIEFLTGGSPPFVPDLEMPTMAENTNEPYVPYYRYLLSQRNSDLPSVISNSYGEPEQTVPKNYAVYTCNLIGQLTLRGVTIFESSGDTGVGSYCTKNDGTNAPTFLPEFPSSCPYITSVGGTQAVSPEVAWADSSGGFSNYFPRPAFQQDAVETYFERHITQDTLEYYKPYFDVKGRAFPDISAHSDAPYFLIVTGRTMSPSGGTSAASPVWGGLIGLLNDARFKAGLPAVGYINPLIYSYGKDFLVDITQGRARGCDGVNHQSGKRVAGSSIIPGAYWNATIGWDPATGLGVPDFQKMLKFFVTDWPPVEESNWGWGRNQENDEEEEEEQEEEVEE